ncbi:MAG: ribosome recycling factor [Myxococcales bacterium]|nr:ribosome recycling factor [Myxococcales bacterium]|tara:strand:- start:1542 stop:2099 length:558 start_codon:yes stop_codon:yes gene_type:complete
MINEVMESFNLDTEATLDSLKRSLGKVRTGRAHAGILDSVRVEYYGAKSPLSQVASVSIPDPRQILIKPWDKNIIGEIERSILKADLGLTPMNDGETIRLNIPPLNTERRRDLTKVVRRIAEEAKISVRNHRRDANELIRAAEKDSDVTEDDARKGQKLVQTATDEAIERIDEVVISKEKEIMED